MAKRRTNNKKKKSKNWIFKMKVYSILFLLFVTVSFYLLALYNNVNIRSKYSYIYIAEYSTPQTVIQLLKENNFLCNNVSFWLMDKIYPINFPRKGLYKIKKGSGNFELIYQLNNQKLYPYRTYSIPVQKIREPLVTDVCSSAGIELSEFKKIIQDSIFLKKLGGFDRINLLHFYTRYLSDKSQN